MTKYEAFLAAKAVTDPFTGISEFPPLPDCLFPHQRDIVSWALRRGRSALFAGTGLGKSLMELAWGQVVAETTGKPVLHLAPLAVSSQLVREADKFVQWIDEQGLMHKTFNTSAKKDVVKFILDKQ